MKSKIKNFETNNSAASFAIIFILTILLVRIITSIKDPDILINDYELHHFYYGLIILIIINLIMLIGKKKFSLYLTLSAVSIGLIADQFFFIAGKLTNEQYSSTLPEAILSGAFILLIVLVIELVRRKVK